MIDFILAKNGLLLLIEKLMVQAGAYKTPETVEEALQKPQLKESTKEAIEILTNANKSLNAYYDLSVQYGRELERVRAENLKLNRQVSKLKIENNRLTVQNEELINHVKL